MADDVRDRMIRSAIHVLAREGYQGASFSAVLAHSGAPRGSIYHHFPGGKDQLVAAAIEATLQRGITHLEAYRGRPLSMVLKGISTYWRAILERSDCTAGCPLVTTSIGATDPTLRETLASATDRWRRHYRDVLENAGVPRRRAADVAALLFSGYEGAVHLSRAERSLDVFDDASRALRRSATALAVSR